MRVEVLSTDASTSTLDFEVTKLTVDGDLLHIRSTATHVFRKHSGRWRVVETVGDDGGVLRSVGLESMYYLEGICDRNGVALEAGGEYVENSGRLPGRTTTS